MIISEKQIMQLMAYINALTMVDCPPEALRLSANELVDEIRNQQSEELKVIE